VGHPDDRPFHPIGVHDLRFPDEAGRIDVHARSFPKLRNGDSARPGAKWPKKIPARFDPSQRGIADIKSGLYYDRRVLVDLFDYALPADRIAQEPRERGTSRLLVLDRETGAIAHRGIADLPSLLEPGDLLVRNDARVIPARLRGSRDGRDVEIFLLEEDADGRWTCRARPGRRARPGDVIDLPGGTRATVAGLSPGGKRVVAFEPPLSRERLAAIGHVPLPPYIRRPDDARDRDWYQTIFARSEGAVAAPTAGLHFTAAIFEALRARGVGIADLTLLVGAGTFKPVTADDAEAHVMDGERVRIPGETIARILDTRARGGKIVAVGTTVTRALEAWRMEERETFTTNLFITPGFAFRVVDALVTNFHLPRSTLLMLVSAFAGRANVLDAYAEALRGDYRFYSYGDAMFVSPLRGGRLPAPPPPDRRSAPR
jgi:S-adenosylmethionine:tRNA ribosyltransferase-isomerase